RTLSLGKFEVSDVLFVVDEEGKLLGYLKVLDLLREDPESNLGRICKKDLVTVNPEEDREEVAKLMVKYDISRLPVVDEEGRLLGVVTIEDVADVIVAEHGEDYLLLGGLPKMEDYRYLTARPTSLFRKRFLWLLAIYLVESVTARIIKGFGVMISETAIIAAFIPLILATGGNVGSQASTLVVRALALGEVTPRDYLRIVLKELSTSILISPAIASVGFVFAYTISLDLRISLIVSLALGLVTITADITGALLPLLATIFKVDPATISSPLIATISDVSGLVVYLTLASLLLGVV
ncbi:magnesium transporter, partial [Thermococci archaeon]